MSTILNFTDSHAIRGIAVVATRARVKTNGPPQVIITRLLSSRHIAAEVIWCYRAPRKPPAVIDLALLALFDPDLVVMADPILVAMIECV